MRGIGILDPAVLIPTPIPTLSPSLAWGGGGGGGGGGRVSGWSGWGCRGSVTVWWSCTGGVWRCDRWTLRYTVHRGAGGVKRRRGRGAGPGCGRRVGPSPAHACPAGVVWPDPPPLWVVVLGSVDGWRVRWRLLAIPSGQILYRISWPGGLHRWLADDILGVARVNFAPRPAAPGSIERQGGLRHGQTQTQEDLGARAVRVRRTGGVHRRLRMRCRPAYLLVPPMPDARDIRQRLANAPMLIMQETSSCR